MRDQEILNKSFEKIEGRKTMTYEETADLFFATMTGQMTGVTREQLMALMKEKLPTLELLNAALREASDTYALMVATKGPMQ